ncbi:MAG: thioesterase family protein [Paracoccus sp. (in: a-proteobacteria)]|uniref:thioesterase family protein n=1 Tax=Paracoccus sp. TaxID=267 RepID=UPI0026E0CC8F|nr:thioesterase family protein [Paracoccus sp. (in: a-proteobacteria)]MDO5614534.1 thioesterase family protein [Paracoccus sp. (in: a-proteobacteria)]
MARIAFIGGGEAGHGWIARFILGGDDVAVFDADPGGAAALSRVLADAGRAWGRLFQAPLPEPGRVIPAPELADAVAGADYIIVSLPDADPRTIARIEAAAPAQAIIALSDGGALRDLQQGAQYPDRIIRVTGCAPVYLLPLAEITGADAAAGRAAAMLADAGMQPVRTATATGAPVGHRLSARLLAEARHLVDDGQASAAQIDDILRLGSGLSLAWAGLWGTADPAAGRPEGQAGDPAHLRDEALTGILHALKAAGQGAGQVVRDAENRLYGRAVPPPAGYPLRLHQVTVGGAWLDYNGHMTEFRYLQVMGDATDAFLIHIGLGPEYRAGGHSAYTVETHIRHLAEVSAGERLSVETRLIGHDAKRFRLHHRILRADGVEAATGEHMLLHVNSAAGRAVPMPDPLIAALDGVAAQDQGPLPDHAGQGIRDIGGGAVRG